MLPSISCYNSFMLSLISTDKDLYWKTYLRNSYIIDLFIYNFVSIL